MEKGISTLPKYDNPPVAEVALSVQFEPLIRFRTPHIGPLWDEYKAKGLTLIEERQPIDQVFELFGKVRLIPKVEISSLPPVSRCLFLNEDKTELVQVQNDHFVHNWKKEGKTGLEYPTWESIREKFVEDWGTFQSFIKKLEIGELQVNQCEVVYVNPILISDAVNNYNELQDIITVFKNDYSDSFLSSIEGLTLNLKYIISRPNEKPLGRLHISVHSKILNEKNTIMLNLLARGKPFSNDIGGILGFLDLGHEWIVRGFTSFTTDKMHKIWKRRI